MIRIKPLFYLIVVILFVTSCEEYIDNDDIYDRPDWLAGKLYSQLIEQENISIFAECLELTGYDTIINTSGCYTVFAPDDDAFETYLANIGYSSVEEIPVDELTRMVKYHIIQNPWSFEQLQSLDIYGWIDSTDETNDEAKGYKRETILRESNKKHGIIYESSSIIRIVDTTESSYYRIHNTDSRKYAPVFYDDYFEIYDLNSDDYEYYFDREFEPGEVFYMGGKITEEDIFAENGFIHIIDKVNKPLYNAYEILRDEDNEYSYKSFLDLVNYFPEFTYDEDATNDQTGAEEGAEVDSLFDITYPDLTFNILNEETTAPSGDVDFSVIRYHHGMIAPTDEAFETFENKYFVGTNMWGSIEESPIHIKRIVVNTHMSTYPVYPSYFDDEIYNGEGDYVSFDESTVIQKQYSSNCTFIGVNQMIDPRAFISVTGPVYLNRGYQVSMYAIEYAELLAALKRKGKEYMLFVEPDSKMSQDSSLIYNSSEETFAAYIISTGVKKRVSFNEADVRLLLLNHIGTSIPTGNCRKEFIENLAGNYIIVDNETGIYSGTQSTSVGYNGSTSIDIIPTQISTDADNGVTYSIDSWFSFTANTMYVKISASFPDFMELLQKADLTNDNTYELTFTSDNVDYTVFIPSDEALEACQADTLTGDNLEDFLLMHFIQGDMIFTDGKMSAGYYETACIDDEQSTTYTTVYRKVYIEPGMDVIEIRGIDGNTYVSVEEDSETTNIFTGDDLDTEASALTQYFINGVLHQIETPLIYDELDTQ